MSKIFASVADVNAALDQYASDIPRDFMLGWISRESNFWLNDIESTGERSLFQLSRSEQNLVGADPDRLVSDVDYAVQKGVDLVRLYAAAAHNDFGFEYGTFTFWHIVKLIHTVGAGGTRTILSTAGADPSWDTVVASNQSRLAQTVGGRSIASAFDIVEGVFQQGADLAGGTAPEAPTSDSSGAVAAGGFGVALGLGVLLFYLVRKRRRQGLGGSPAEHAVQGSGALRSAASFAQSALAQAARGNCAGALPYAFKAERAWGEAKAHHDSAPLAGRGRVEQDMERMRRLLLRCRRRA